MLKERQTAGENEVVPSSSSSYSVILRTWMSMAIVGIVCVCVDVDFLCAASDAGTEQAAHQHQHSMSASDATTATTTGKKRPLGGKLDGWLKKPKTAADGSTSGGSGDAAGDGCC